MICIIKLVLPIKAHKVLLYILVTQITIIYYVGRGMKNIFQYFNYILILYNCLNVERITL